MHRASALMRPMPRILQLKLTHAQEDKVKVGPRETQLSHRRVT
eukprot:CAMPEP_0175452838 /NCGR_PEP_ID=MMETSP0095-20121207/63622_1 /TAXON_ID=311494 /ORGANISM="Alexandrium monilatum, Strain CCMP3105" /LENGTH=42 /DNA_ID= /DNA_START= /DNA_END= /DNA_ORIENTATION=